MKKTLIAAAALAVAGAASAQVTLSGTFNVDVQNTPTASKATVGMGDAIVSFAAVEDLGGGMSIKASTTLQTKGGRATEVSNNGWSFALGTANMGTLTLSNYLNAQNNLSIGVSAENDMSDMFGSYNLRTRLNYALPELIKGLTVQLRWDATAESSVLSSTGTTIAGPGAVTNSGFSNTKWSLGYTMGALALGAGGTRNSDFIDDVSASYNFGIAKASIYHHMNNDATSWAIQMPLGAASVGVVQEKKGTTVDGTGFVASYALSKRTSASFNYAYQKVGATAANDGKGNYRIRLAHTF